MKRFILFHVYQVRFWEEICRELTQLIDASGLMAEAELLHNYADAERLSINRLRDLSIQRPGQQALYIHTKGVTKDYYTCSIHDWRKMMSYFLIEHWRECVQKLDEGYDTVGCNWVDGEGFYSGNFFWASTDYLRQLRPIPEKHHVNAAEAWIGGRLPLPERAWHTDVEFVQPLRMPETHRHYEMHRSNVNHYYHCYHRDQYAEAAPAAL